jgi:Uma2 family endonuclease
MASTVMRQRRRKLKGRFPTLEDVLTQLGGIPASRLLIEPSPGSATEADLILIEASGGPICELIDGALVRKHVGAAGEWDTAFFESRLAMILGVFIEIYLQKRKLGIVVGEGAYLRVYRGQVRAPDLSYISWTTMPGGEVPDDPVAPFAPDLAVEVITKSNTKAEMDRKLRDYFKGGCKLVWYVYPKTRTVHVYTDLGKPVVLTEDDKLDGGKVLPGFSLSIRKWFRKARTRPAK